MAFEESRNQLSQLLIVVHKKYCGCALQLGRAVRGVFLGEYHINIHGCAPGRSRNDIGVVFAALRLRQMSPLNQDVSLRRGLFRTETIGSAEI
jgi:hypothetical protein